MSYLKRAILSVVVILALSAVYTTAYAGDTIGDGVYIGVSGQSVNIFEGGEFDGESILADSDEIILIPEIENGLGWGLVLGSKKGNGAIEIAYMRSEHDMTWNGAKGDGTLSHVDINFKTYFLAKKPVQPYLQLGWLLYSRIVVKDGSGNEDGEVGDAKFESFLSGINFGGGVSVYFIPHIAFTAGAVYQAIAFTKAEGVNGESGGIKESLGLGAMVYQAGLQFIF